MLYYFKDVATAFYISRYQRFSINIIKSILQNEYQKEDYKRFLITKKNLLDVLVTLFALEMVKFRKIPILFKASKDKKNILDSCVEIINLVFETYDNSLIIQKFSWNKDKFTFLFEHKKCFKES